MTATTHTLLALAAAFGAAGNIMILIKLAGQ